MTKTPAWLFFFPGDSGEMISTGLEPHVGVDETSGKEKQDLLSLDVNHQFNIRCPFGDTRVMPMQINISC